MPVNGKIILFPRVARFSQFDALSCIRFSDLPLFANFSIAISFLLSDIATWSPKIDEMEN